MSSPRVFSLLALVAGMAACATPGQVRQVETRIAVMERENAREDSLRAADARRIQAAVSALNTDMLKMFTATARDLDSLKMGNRNLSFDIIGIKKDLVQLGQAVNENSSDLARTKAAIQEMEAGARPTSGSGAGGSTTSNSSGDEVLMRLAQQSLDASAYSESRNNLHSLLDSFPNSPLVPKAYLMLGKSFVSPAQPDSQKFYFTKVYELYPKADDAPAAVYKLGKLGETATPEDKVTTRKWYTILKDQYPNDPSTISALDWLKQNP